MPLSSLSFNYTFYFLDRLEYGERRGCTTKEHSGQTKGYKHKNGHKGQCKAGLYQPSVYKKFSFSILSNLSILWWFYVLIVCFYYMLQFYIKLINFIS